MEKEVMSSKVLLDSINRLRECLSNTTAALAPYPVTGVSNNKFRTKKRTQKVCDKDNEKA